MEYTFLTQFIGEPEYRHYKTSTLIFLKVYTFYCGEVILFFLLLFKNLSNKIHGSGHVSAVAYTQQCVVVEFPFKPDFDVVGRCLYFVFFMS